MLKSRQNFEKQTDWFIFEQDMGKKARTRQLIVEKSARIFNQKGYAGTSMKDIEKATSLSKGAIYGSFNSKEEIAIACFDYAVDLVSNSVRQLSRSKTKSYEKLIAALDFYKEYLFNEPVEGGCPILNMSPEVDDTNPILRERVVNAMETWQYSVKRVVEKGIKQGEIKPDVNAAHFATFFVAALEGGILMSRAYQQSKQLNIVLNQLEKIIRLELIMDKEE